MLKLASSIRVPGVGPKDAKVVILGEAPGEHEVAAGRPFVGPSGNLLRTSLGKVGLNPNDCYFTNVVKVRPSGNDFGVFYEDKGRRTQSELLRSSLVELDLELRALKPNVILAVGAEALRAVAGDRRGGITAWRGSILNTPYGKCVGTYHPAYILRVYSDLPIFEFDLARAKAESNSPHLALPEKRIAIEPSFQQVLSYLRNRPSRLSFDIETTYGSFVRCIGLSHNGIDALVIPFMCVPSQYRRGAGTLSMGGSGNESYNSYWSRDEELVILQELDNLLRDPKVRKVAQNAPFDTTVLGKEFGFDVVNLSSDTMVRHWTCYAEMRKALDFLTTMYTRNPYYSDYDAASDRSTWTYCGEDALNTWLVDEALDKEVKDCGVEEYYENHQHPSIFAFTRAQNRGIKIDLHERDKQLGVLNTEIQRLEAQIRLQVGREDFNVNSPKQVGDYLYNTLKLPPVLHHKTKAITTDKNAMEKLEKKHPQHAALFLALKEHGSLTTVRSGFYHLKLPLGRLFTGYNNAGTVTGRLASSAIFTHPDDSTNLQNLQRYNPKRPKVTLVRRCLVPDEGFVLLKCDLSQAEFRLVVWFANIQRLIEQYHLSPDFDVHKWVASLIFKKPESEITKDERDIAKNGVYGGNYKMHYTTAARTYKLDIRMAEFVLNKYREVIPEIPQWWDSVQRDLHRARVLENPLGMRRIFFGRLDDELLRSALSHLPQSTVGGIINRAGALADDIFDPTECPLLLQVHDELVWQCVRSRVHHYVPIIRNLMEYPLSFTGVQQPLIIPADISVGFNSLDVVKYESNFDYENCQHDACACGASVLFVERPSQVICPSCAKKAKVAA